MKNEKWSFHGEGTKDHAMSVLLLGLEAHYECKRAGDMVSYGTESAIHFALFGLQREFMPQLHQRMAWC